VILQEISDERYELERERSPDWRAVFGGLVMAWCSTQDPARALLTFKRWGVISFTLRVRHLEAVIGVICGPLPSY
jgi:hypothetical protein